MTHSSYRFLSINNPIPAMMTFSLRFCTLVLVLLALTFPSAHAQTPAATVENGSGTMVFQSNTDGGLLVPGTFAFGTIPASGAGTRLMWHPGKAAFRAGRVNGAEWDDANIGHYSMAFGRQTEASGQSSTAMGNATVASGDYSTAMGSITAASGGWSTAMGSGTTASSAFSTAMGRSTTASGDYSTAMGQSTAASGDWSTAMGQSTAAEGPEATAMGRGTIASGPSSTAMGNGTTASGDYSTATGFHTTAASDHSLSIGRHNSANTTADNTLLVAGNGTSAIEFDALVLDGSGNLTIAGTLTESSDRRLKEQIQPLGASVLGKLGEIRPVRFRFRDEQTHPPGEQLGLIAQEVQAQFPALVNEGSGYLSVSYSKFTAVLLKGMQEQQAQIGRLQKKASRVNALEERLSRLETNKALPAGTDWPLGMLLGALALGGFALFRRRQEEGWWSSRAASFLLLAGALALTAPVAVRAQTVTMQNGATLRMAANGTLDLGTTTTLEETDGRVAGSGTVTARRVLDAPSDANVAGLGVVISSSQDLSMTVVTRGHAPQTTGGNSGIARYYDIEPTNNSGLGATLTFAYHDAELNGLDEATLTFFRSADGGASYATAGHDSRDASANTVTLSGIDSFSRWTVASENAPLPVELTSFEAHASDDGSTHLTWQTASETGNARFEVQRQTNPQSQTQNPKWKTIGKKEGAGTTTEAQHYRFTDETVPFVADSLTYRLKQIDWDGAEAFSDPVTVALDAPQRFVVHGAFPNPARGQATIRYKLPEARSVQVHVFNALGQRVRTLTSEQQEAGRQAVHLSTRDLPSGVYFYRVAAGNHAATHRLVVAK